MGRTGIERYFRAKQNLYILQRPRQYESCQEWDKKDCQSYHSTKKQPEIGQVKELLKGVSHEFRYLVHQSYKIIYWINWEQNEVEIVDVFHTKQYPEKMKRTK